MKNVQSKCFILSSSNIQNIRVRNELYDFLLSKFDNVFFVGDFHIETNKNIIKWSGAYNRKGLIYEFIIFYRLFLVLIKHKPSHIISFAPKNNIYCGALKPFFNYKLATVISGFGSFSNKITTNNSFLNYLFRITISNSNIIIAMNIQNFQFLQKKFDKMKVFRISSEGLQTNITVKNKSSETQLLYLSRIIPEKGIFLIIEAFKKMYNIENSLFLHIAGEMSLSENEKKIFYNKIKHSNIYYHGEVTELEKVELLNNANVVILPSIYGEGLPMILLEAQLYMSLIITTKVPGCIDGISEPMKQFCCDFTEDSIFESIKKCINLDPVERNTILYHSREWVNSLHNKTIINNSYDQIFENRNFYKNK